MGEHIHNIEPGQILQFDDEPMMMVSVKAFNGLTVALAETTRALAAQTKPHFYDSAPPAGFEWQIYEGMPVQVPVAVQKCVMCQCPANRMCPACGRMLCDGHYVIHSCLESVAGA